MNAIPWRLVCIACGTDYPGLEVRYRCDCGDVLDVVHDPPPTGVRVDRAAFDARRASLRPIDRSGVWRFRELILPLEERHIVTKPEGNTNLYRSPALAAWVGLDTLLLKHEGENPTGSFKDRGMTVGTSVARAVGLQSVACASTGNTSASMAAYAAEAGMKAFVFIPHGRVASGKLSQALAYGAKTIQIDSDFDAAMTLVEGVCRERGVYLLNSINPFRIEGQKAIAFELLSDLAWSVPDWIVVPGGNLGNSSAIAKGLVQLRELGVIAKLPRLAIVQAHGANPLYRAVASGRPFARVDNAETLATAIRIGNPVSWKKAMRGLADTGGVVEEVTDQEILDAKAHVDRAGIGAEPASCASVGGLKKLVDRGIVKRGETAVTILTGHVLKDPDIVVAYHEKRLAGIASNVANPPVRCAATFKAVVAAMDEA